MTPDRNRFTGMQTAARANHDIASIPHADQIFNTRHTTRQRFGDAAPPNPGANRHVPGVMCQSRRANCAYALKSQESIDNINNSLLFVRRRLIPTERSNSRNSASRCPALGVKSCVGRVANTKPLRGEYATPSFLRNFTVANLPTSSPSRRGGKPRRGLPCISNGRTCPKLYYPTSPAPPRVCKCVASGRRSRRPANEKACVGASEGGTEPAPTVQETGPKERPVSGRDDPGLHAAVRG